jgi:DNA-binding transcriptional LysR family regulator
LQLETRPGAWAAWFARGGRAVPAEGMRFDQFAPMIEAAVHGLGVALLPDFLAGEELASGRLVALEPARPGGGAYWLVWPDPARGSPALVAFRDWLAEEAAARRWT